MTTGSPQVGRAPEDTTRDAADRLAPALNVDWPDRTLAADEIPWSLEGGGPWPTTDAIVALAIRTLPDIDDAGTAALIRELLYAIVTIRERGRSLQRLVAVGLDEWHERDRAHLRRLRMREARRAARRTQ